jgi:hypothetical protein
MVSPCRRNLAGQMNDDLGSRQGKKHSSPDMKKDIDILMASLAKLEVYVEKEGRTLDPDEMPVPDAISVGLADLVHGSALADFNTQFHRNRERRRLVPISSLLNHLETTDPISPPSPMQPPQITDAHSVPSPNPSRVMHVQLAVSPIPVEAVVHHVDLPDAANSSDSDEDDFADLDTVTRDDFKPMSFGLVTEADVAMDMDSVVHYLEDDENPWDDIFGEHGSESGASTDRDEADYESS